MTVSSPAFAQDADLDGVPDASDNCVNVFNPLQADGDGDAAGNVCDCAPAEAINAQLLGPAGALMFTSDADVVWAAPQDGGPFVYDLLRATRPDMTLAACIESDMLDLAAVDGAVPAAGEAFFYAVRAQDGCGGNLGSDAGEARRAGANCPPGSLVATCTEAMDASCPNTTPACAGVSFGGGVGCFSEFITSCYDTGLRSYKATLAQPLSIGFAGDVTSLETFFSHEVSTSAGTMRFFDADNLEVVPALPSEGPCGSGVMPPRRALDFGRPVRRAEVRPSGAGDLWIDTFTVNPNAPLPTCTETMDSSCPNTSPVCLGVTFTGGVGCFREFLTSCYDTGLFSYKVTQAAPLTIQFGGGVTSLSVFFAHETSGTTGTMRFFDSSGALVDAITSLGPCAGAPMPPARTLSFTTPVRRVEVVVSGTGDVWIDTFTVNP